MEMLVFVCVNKWRRLYQFRRALSVVGIAVLMTIFMTGCAALGSKEGGRYELASPNFNESSINLQTDCVVILHGLARNSRSMTRLYNAFAEQGFRTLNIDYPSTEMSLQDLLKQVIIPKVQEACPDTKYRLHFVGHSMGGILARLFAQSVTDSQLHGGPDSELLGKVGSVVAIASPHGGSELVDRLSWLPVFGWLNGPAGKQMSTSDNDGVQALLNEPDYPLMVIAGTRSTNPLYSLLIPGQDDGKVSIESSKSANATSYLEVPYAHTFIMNKTSVIEATLQFVRQHSKSHIFKK